MRIFLFLFFIALIPQVAQAGGFVDHLSEAITSNRARLQGYARLSGGSSRLLSQILIGVENTSLPLAYLVDWRASGFQAAGIPIVQLDFVSMSLTPAFTEELLPPLPDSVPYREVPWRKWRDRIYELSEQKRFFQLHREIAGWVAQLNQQPRFHVMVRHVLESTARIAFLAPQYQAMATARKYPYSPLPLSQHLLELHATSLWISDQLDFRAHPLQRKGIQILMRDVPIIEMSPLVDESAGCPKRVTLNGTEDNI